jgi:hypothetical protein
MMSSEKCVIPGVMLPGYRYEQAVKAGTTRKILLRTWGGIGDQICAEPTLRFALKAFDKSEVSLATPFPSLFAHLPFKRVFNLNQEQPVWENYFVFDTIVPSDHLMWTFISHAITNCVDFPSMCAFRLHLPNQDKEVRLPIRRSTVSLELQTIVSREHDRMVVVHSGKHWPSKTFPKDWWDSVLSELRACGFVPVLIGADADDNRSTVDVDPQGCLDLRNKTSLAESIWLTQQTKVLLTNDSSPLHMAVSGDAWIGYVATCKHPDYITHWRNGAWSWRMKNLGLGGVWDVMSFCPNVTEEIKVDLVEESVLRSWLPEPRTVALWTQEKMENWTPRKLDLTDKYLSLLAAS